MDHVAHMIPATVGALEPMGADTTRLVIGADDMSWLARYLLGLPWEFEVESPDELRKELRKIGRRLLTVRQSS